ncbi:MAG: hypothetical protein IE916_08650 [Epsilonproteobacteria bacterium]|nr:hypothetical protein [Campylobacterota bacterium]
MKLGKIALASLALVASLYAGDAQKQSLLAVDMRTMLSAMQDVERAGFYSDVDGMKAGLNKLKGALRSLMTTDAKSYLPDDQAYADKFAHKRASMITMYADDMIAALNAKNMDDALDDYTQILKQCNSCHIRIRAW